LPDVSWHNIPKTWKINQIVTKLPNFRKIYQMAVIYSKLHRKYAKIFRSKSLQILPKLGYLVRKYTIWQPWCRRLRSAQTGSRILLLNILVFWYTKKQEQKMALLLSTTLKMSLETSLAGQCWQMVNLQNKKFQFGYIFKSLGMRNVGIIYGIWNILRSFGIL
jgi:hypothetical protein